jgi:nitrogen fixation/metabolism regulation signal transduction histidine kinase
MYCLFKTAWIIVPVIAFGCIAISIIELIAYIDRTNLDFTDFLLAIKNSDFSKRNIQDKRGKTFSGLKNAQNIILEEFQRTRIDKETHYFLLQNVVEYTDTAILLFNKRGEIVLMNRAAEKLLNVPYLKNISSFKSGFPKLHKLILDEKPENNPVIEYERNNEKLMLHVRIARFQIEGVDNTLVCLNNIKNELEDSEIQAWEKLISVLTHEIMNSITPVASLSSILKNKADELVEQKKENEKIHDIAEGLNVIERRSLGLMSFVDSYKTLAVLPKPEFKNVNLKELFKRINTLKHEELSKKGIVFKVNYGPDSLHAFLDPDLIEQVLINLINNSADACSGVTSPIIELWCETQDDKLIILIKDNGSGIDKELTGKIFVPFFTTRRNGTGVGLSFSKQVLRMHGGTIHVESELHKGTTFSLRF